MTSKTYLASSDRVPGLIPSSTPTPPLAQARKLVQRRPKGTWRTSLAAIALMLALGLSMGQPQPAHAAAITADGTTCTLADAITAANTDTATGGCGAGSGADTITLGADVSLGSALPDITTEMTIEGAGHTINATATGFSVLKVTSTGNLTLNQATISGGSTPNGGGINNAGTLTVQNSTLSGNTASEGSGNGLGGGIYNAGTLTVQNSTLSGNMTKSTIGSGAAEGGGIYNTGTLTVQNSTLSGNTTGGAGSGGGIYNAGTLTVQNSTLSGNTASSAGGGIGGTGSMTVQNSTISGNNARAGGGISARNLTLQNSTIASNTATDNSGGIFSNGGTLQRSLISGNSAPTASEVRGGRTPITADSFNLFGHSSVTNAQAFRDFAPGSSDIMATSNGTNVALASILNETLANNGTQPHPFTHALVSGSPAINQIPTTDDSCNPGSSTDQRGAARAGGTNKGDSACDIGAFEFSSTQTPTAITLSQFTATGASGGLVAWAVMALGGLAVGWAGVRRWVSQARPVADG